MTQPPAWGAPPPAGQPQPYPQAPGYPGAGPGPAAPYVTSRTDGMAVAALICSIAAFLVCPVILAVVALALAHAAGNRIDASGGLKKGEGMVRAAQIISWVHLTLVLLGLALAVILVAANGGEITTDSLRALGTLSLG
jgi:hypothetical protein